MDETLRHHNPNPSVNANLFSRIFFCWLNPLFKDGYKRPLETSDMFNVAPQDASDMLGDKLEREWMKEIKKQKKTGKKPSLMKALIRMFGFKYMLLGIIILFEEGTKVVQPVLLGGLIRYFTREATITKTDAYMYALGVSLCAVVLAITHHPYFFIVTRLGMQMRVACCSLMYKKSLRLSNKALGETTTGQIVNLMSNDVNRFDQAVIFLHFMWVGPLQALAVLIILWHELGPTVLAGFAVLLLLIPVQGWMGKLFSKLRQKTAVFTDDRVRIMNEIISAIRVIKMYCWEKPFGELVRKVRRLELKHVYRVKKLKSFQAGSSHIGSRLMAYGVVLAFVLSRHREGFRARNIFLMLPMFGVISKQVIFRMGLAVSAAAELLVTISRFRTFLLLEETEHSSSVVHNDLPAKTHDCFIRMNNVTAKWDKNVDQNTLEKISLDVRPGELVAVIGPVGAGKSSLLMSLLGELPASEGSIAIGGRVAYVSQQPWVFSASVRQNVLFGQQMDDSFYSKCLSACALNKDLDIFPNGDSTQIGDRGVSLSGGQRARVSLARSLYTDADIYLLDDPLSAVDAAVGKHIFQRVIQGVLKKKPRILVTHQLQYLQAADRILILKEGRLMGTGTYEELSRSGIDFASLLKVEEKDETGVPGFYSSHAIGQSSSKINNIGSTVSLNSITSDFEPEKVQVCEEETKKVGTVGFGVYLEYFKAGSNIFTFTLLIVMNLLAQLSYIMSDWWLARWSNQEEARVAKIKEYEAAGWTGFNNTYIGAYNPSTNTSTPTVSTNFSVDLHNSNITIDIPVVDSNTNLYIFSGIVGSVFLFGLLRALLFFKIAIDASQKLHNRMFTNILRAPVVFFDANPVGRILNRFSKDIGHMDDLLPITFFDFIQCALLILGIVVVTGAVNPWVFIPVGPLGVLFIVVRQYYLRTSRSVKRLEATCRSPVFSHLSASLQGLHTIRAFGMQSKFMQEFDAHQDLHTEAWFLFLSTSRWLAVRLDWLCVTFVTAVTMCSVIASENLDAGLVGLSVTYAMTLMGLFQWGVRQSAEVENQMISVERVLEYSKISPEAALESDPEHKPPSDWPKHGIITGEGVCLKYAETAPCVLKELNFCVRSKEKVGVVGRTGAGKSSLVTVLFRLFEPTGKLLIDGVNIREIGLHDLRRTISIIPQDPVLFTGSLRHNLDPFNQHDDQQLWRALEEVQLKPAIEDLPGKLEMEVSEGGINFSVGQRQLICLARAILGRSRILMIDEATANVDPRTDELIQATIREKFRDCTVLTIAHRLHTIMDSDRVLILDAGRIVQFDEPFILLNKKCGMFYDIVQQTGKTESEDLLQVAELAFERRKITNSLNKGDNSPSKGDNEDIPEENIANHIGVGGKPEISDEETDIQEKKPAKTEELNDEGRTDLGNRTAKQFLVDLENHRMSNSVSEKMGLLDSTSDQEDLTDDTRKHSSDVCVEDPSSVDAPLLDDTASDNSLHV
ncbi:ATP-binding cassette sub-family C member 4-like [Gigantopelta aegis]|uniref:ATP-binding cassette sub-family C member 4-like n=1 Tax=Gigantopelta aegis TaxID=1735272 RepID=UPI001B88CF6D|nr:ATP-binding cassette sub-family C member 4-like [Gigantopelta aegis]